ncbi:DUF4382 domain-containing protein [Seonamhaeicola sp. ML3]|uniref:DUF4382 domain-containing protein n=1 Tax=Seonamhaeicola sp. ML3 TaxID=2937786 RepID=UPI00200D333D|nr:DUF4382 domain-containing protein [Seonamhaeicola sp. ML3]
MKTQVKTIILAVILLAGITSCSKNDDPTNDETYPTAVHITDAPIDNTNVKGAFVTITDVKIDGNSIEGFSKTTIDLMAYQNGSTKLLGNLDLKSRMYSNISLVIDTASDANGNAPGCYILTTDNTKHALASVSNEIQINDSFEVLRSNANKMVIDFDLRKTITSQTESSNAFDFVTASELSNGLRIVNDLETGEIQGNVSDSENTSDKIVVYAYKKGSFNAESETKGQGASKIEFANAVTSSVVNNITGSYELNFLDEGEYELHFASYNKTDNSNTFKFSAMLNVESSTSVNLGSIKVDANSQLSASVLVLGHLQ